MTILKVKKFNNRFGITDGKYWFAYTYESKEVAEKVLEKLIPASFKVNICWKEPVVESNIK